MALTDNLISYWRLEEASGSRADSVGTNTLTDTNTVTQNPGFLTGMAAQFTRINNEYLVRADNADLSTGDIDFTISAWAYFDAVSGVDCTIMEKDDASPNAEYFFYLHNLMMQFFVSSSGATSYTGVIHPNILQPATWYHVMAWHDSVNNELGIAVNNVPIVVPYSGGVFNGAADMRIGYRPVQGDAMGGRISDVGFWKRILTASERTQLWNNGRGLAYPFTDPVSLVDSLQAFWRLDEMDGNRSDVLGVETLTDNNTVLSVAGRVGRNGALFVAANSESLSRADDAGLSIAGNVDFTISLWVRFNSLSVCRIVGKWNNSPSNEYTILLNPTINFSVSGDGTATTQVTGPYPTTGVWYHIVAWHDATRDVIAISVNNGPPVFAAHSAGVFNGTAAFRMGSLDGGAQYLDGTLSMVGLWKRVLTANERMILYNNGQGLNYPFQDIFVLQPFPKARLLQGAHL